MSSADGHPAAIEPVRDCWFLTGPTASGKSKVGVELARRLGAEIVSMDSMALYRHMDIGTAKPTPGERQSVPHHLIDLLKPSEEFSLAQYVEAAHAAVDKIHGGGREVLFVGGTPLYLKALLRGIFEGPPADWSLRNRLEEEAERLGGQALHDRLARVDADSAARLHPNDRRRIIRALEVYEKTGEPISRHQRQFERPRDANTSRVALVAWGMAELDSRINARVESMFHSGLVEEVRQLQEGTDSEQTSPADDQNALPEPPARDARLALSRTARQALGYREVLEHLAGVRGLAETIERVKLRTRQFARRQRTWFRSLAECRAIEVTEPLAASAVADRAVRLFEEANSLRADGREEQ